MRSSFSIRSSKRRRFAAGLICAVTFAGCGPVYDTQYQFTPPENESGRTCVFQCETSKEQCQQIQEMRAESCEDRAEYEYERCVDRIYRRKGREPKWHECSKETCSADVDRCENTYRNCYQACGGKVRAETVCVANCDQVPPGQPNVR